MTAASTAVVTHAANRGPRMSTLVDAGSVEVCRGNSSWPQSSESYGREGFADPGPAVLDTTSDQCEGSNPAERNPAHDVSDREVLAVPHPGLRRADHALGLGVALGLKTRHPVER